MEVSMLLKKTLFSAFMAAGILLSVSALEVQADPLETGTKAMQETQESAQAANAGDLTESSMKNYAVASVSEGSYVNVRENAGTEYPVVGKLENHGLCYIQEQSGEWYRVVSGEVEGYIRGDLLKTGEEAWMEVHASGEENMPVASVLNTREELVTYACQFVGNPYVWGGTSLTNGVDCSGFTQQVFANYGISLPHSSKAQAGCGTAVDVQEAQPGDLIFYADNGSIYHVVIYIGNGQAVHASSAKTGIKISDVQYDKASCAVSLL